MIATKPRRAQAASTLAEREAAHATLLAISHTLPSDARTREAFFWGYLVADDSATALRRWRELEARAAAADWTAAEACLAAYEALLATPVTLMVQEAVTR